MASGWSRVLDPGAWVWGGLRFRGSVGFGRNSNLYRSMLLWFPSLNSPNYEGGGPRGVV